MRKIIVLSYMTLDGVMQAPGRADGDASDGFNYGGWSAPYFQEADDAAIEFMVKYIKPADLLLGRKTFEAFADFWPSNGHLWPGVNEATKYVLSNTVKENKTEWGNVIFLNNVDAIRKLRDAEGAPIQVHGSADLAQTLFKYDLVDELWLKTFPITLGQGKRLFGDGTMPAAFRLTDSLVTPNGVIFANYERAGEVKTGIVGG